MIGKPCPETECSVGLAYGFSLDPVTFDSFFSSTTFRDLTSTGASAPDAGFLDPAGLGTVGAQQTDSSVRGRRDDDTQSHGSPNSRNAAISSHIPGRLAMS
jgi:hypothetical protein